MSVVAIIPARGGSKRVPGKNIRPCAGKPLLAWTAEAALGAPSVSRSILSTDDDAIAAAGRACGLEVPFLRPPELAQDGTPTLPVLINILDWLGDNEPVEAIVLLQVTSPLRQAQDIEGAIRLFRDGNADSVVSVTPLPDHYGTAKLMVRHDDGRLQRLDPAAFPPAGQLFVRNGPAVLVTRPDVLRQGSLYGDKILPYVMPAERSIDIDTELDFRMAAALLEG